MSPSPFLARKGPARGPHWGGSSLPQRKGVFLPPPSSAGQWVAMAGARCPQHGAPPRSMCSASVALSPQGSASGGGEGQGSACASIRVFAPGFSWAKCKRLFLMVLLHHKLPPGSCWDEVEIRLACVKLDLNQLSQPTLLSQADFFGGLFVLSDSFKCDN